MLKERIKEQRKLAGLTQRQLAEKTGISLSAIEKYERGKLNPSYRNIQLIAGALNIDTCDLMPEPTLDELDVKESLFERFIDIHGQGFMYNKAPKEIQEQFRKMFEQSLYIDSLVENKEVENIFTDSKQIATVFYDYISRREREFIKLIQDKDKMIEAKDKMILAYQENLNKIIKVIEHE